jgi:type I restriction enzyme S subunit
MKQGWKTKTLGEICDIERGGSPLDDLREETRRLAALYERKLAQLSALKKSLLHQAFNGDL